MPAKNILATTTDHDEEEIPEKVRILCERISNGETFRAVCDEMGWVTQTMWSAINRHEASRRHYTRARESQADAHADAILAIADTPRPGVITTIKDGKIETREADMIEHRRLQVDTRKWLMSKLHPVQYGDKPAGEVTVNLNLGFFSGDVG